VNEGTAGPVGATSGPVLLLEMTGGERSLQ